jgi:SAM-dependent methyltransferase
MIKSVHKENSKAWWEEKYAASNSYLYGKAPSVFLSEVTDLLVPKSRILEVACGEGRNAVALASMGHKVTALDFSTVALERAGVLAKESGVEINFKSVDLDLFLPELLSYDVVVGVDFKPAKTFLSNVSRGLVQNGFLIIEAYLTEACKNRSGLEIFECYAPNELLRLIGSQSAFKILKYSELGPGKWGEKVFLVAQKSQLL